MSYDLVDKLGRILLAVVSGFAATLLIGGVFFLAWLAWRFRSCKP
jgi:hypothetical protein